MQHSSVTATNNSQSQPANSAGSSQAPRFISVISSKNSSGQIKQPGEATIRTINTQGSQMITLNRRTISMTNPINVNVKRIPISGTSNENNNGGNSRSISLVNGLSTTQQQQIFPNNSQQHKFGSSTQNDNNMFNSSSAAHNSFQTYNDSTLNQIQLSQIGQHLQNNNASSTINNNSTYLINDHGTLVHSDNSMVDYHSNALQQLSANNNQTNSSSPSTLRMPPGQIIKTPEGSTYIIQNDPSGVNEKVAVPFHRPYHNVRHQQQPSVSHFRREPKTVQWLTDHFENSEGVSLPRALMYNHYLLHCQEQNLDPVNAASFGKLVRSMFQGLRTRRLGTRGHSKYHYYGIRIKVNSPLNQLHEEITYMTNSMRYNDFNKNRGRSLVRNHSGLSITEQVEQQAQEHQQYLGDAQQALPDLDPIQIVAPLPDGITQEDLINLEDLYRDHCSHILDAIVNLQFSQVKSIWQVFWRFKPHENSSASSSNNSSPAHTNFAQYEEMEVKLPQHKFLSLCKLPSVQKWIKESDHMIYQSLVEVLIPDVLRPIPSALTQAIRNFAKGLEGQLSTVLKQTQVPDELLNLKVAAVSAFSQTLRRYTSLNHLAQAARAVLNNVQQLNQMLTDFNRVDFNNIQDQASWTTECDSSLVNEIQENFKIALAESRTLEQWADWLENVVLSKVLEKAKEPEQVSKIARKFLLNWSFYSSLTIRDLTLRSAASFGSFHLIRLLFDEYMFYIVENRVAQSTGNTTIAIMNDFAMKKKSLESTSSDLLSTPTSVIDEKPVILTAVKSFPSNESYGIEAKTATFKEQPINVKPTIITSSTDLKKPVTILNKINSAQCSSSVSLIASAPVSITNSKIVQIKSAIPKQTTENNLKRTASQAVPDKLNGIPPSKKVVSEHQVSNLKVEPKTQLTTSKGVSMITITRSIPATVKSSPNSANKADSNVNVTESVSADSK